MCRKRGQQVVLGVKLLAVLQFMLVGLISSGTESIIYCTVGEGITMGLRLDLGHSM